MPKVRSDIDNLDLWGRAARLEEKYPWFTKVLDGRVHEIVADKDFTTTLETMRQSLKELADRHGVAVAVRSSGDNLLVQARAKSQKNKTTRRKAGSKR